MAIGVFITFCLLDIADLTVDGSFCTGGAVCVMMILAGYSPAAAMTMAFVVGMITGFATGFFHTVCGIPAILAGILTQLGLWTINLVIMGMKANQYININEFDVFVSLRQLQDVAAGGLHRRIIYYIVVQAVVTLLKLDTNYLKLITALIVALFLTVPYLKSKYTHPKLTPEMLEEEVCEHA